jgi:hypothetical protein
MVLPPAGMALAQIGKELLPVVVSVAVEIK